MAHISKFIGLSEEHFVDFFVCDAESLRYCVDEFLKDCPYLLANQELNSFPGDISKNFITYTKFPYFYRLLRELKKEERITKTFFP